MATPFLPDLGGIAKKTIMQKPRASSITSPLNHEIAPSLRSLSYGAKKLELQLKLKPKSPIIIEGFPGLGFVATIATEYLLDHLKMHPIGRVWSPRFVPMALIHNKRIVQPIEIFHNDKHNLIVTEAVSGVGGLEWELAEAIISLYKKTNAKEIISIEGISGPVERKVPQVYYFTNQPDKKAVLEKIGLKEIAEGVIFGVSGALMIKLPKDVKVIALFVETHSDLPDSRAAAKLIQVLDQYLGLKIDYKPLLKRAAGFEEKLRELIGQTKDAAMLKKEKEPATPYIG
jgi:predicted ATP-grasp superfamily ATP-dependent carboligase